MENYRRLKMKETITDKIVECKSLLKEAEQSFLIDNNKVGNLYLKMCYNTMKEIYNLEGETERFYTLAYRYNKIEMDYVKRG